MSRQNLAKISWCKVFNSKKIESLLEAVEIFFNEYESLISKFDSDLSQIKLKKEIYIFPSSDINFASQMKILTIFGFEIVYQITKEELIKTTIDKFISNKKFVTPDVCFYILTLVNETLMYINYQEKITQFLSLISIVEEISNKYSENLKVDLEKMNDLKIDTTNFEKVMKNND